MQLLFKGNCNSQTIACIISDLIPLGQKQQVFLQLCWNHKRLVSTLGWVWLLRANKWFVVPKSISIPTLTKGCIGYSTHAHTQAHTEKFSIEHTSVGLTHAHPMIV